jgi:hypothetical protein
MQMARREHFGRAAKGQIPEKGFSKKPLQKAHFAPISLPSSSRAHAWKHL